MNKDNYTYEDGWHYGEGDLVRKHSGSWWQGRVVGFYSTGQTPRGYAVQLSNVLNGPVQIYPQEALELVCRNSDYDKQAYKQGTIAKRS